MRHSACVILLAAAAVPSACMPYTTYPPVNRVQSPNAVVSEPVPTLIVEAIDYARAHYAPPDAGEDIAINLPANSGVRLYEKIIDGLGAGHPMQDPDEPAYHVTRVAVRSGPAMVDIFVPGAEGYRFATIRFRYEPLRGWFHEHTRWWDTGDEPPGPNYPAAVASAAETERDG